MTVWLLTPAMAPIWTLLQLDSARSGTMTPGPRGCLTRERMQSFGDHPAGVGLAVRADDPGGLSVRFRWGKRPTCPINRPPTDSGHGRELPVRHFRQGRDQAGEVRWSGWRAGWTLWSG